MFRRTAIAAAIVRPVASLRAILVSACTALACLVTFAAGAPAQASPSGHQPSVTASRATAARAGSLRAVVPDTIAPADRGRMLPAGWRQSPDRVVTTDGDSTGLHVLVADARDGYTWRTAATLTEPGTDADQWIGQACVTGSGDRAVVVYAPRQMINDDSTFHGGGLVAVVNLTTGAVTKLPVRASLAYYNPGCGAGEQAVITQNFYRGSDYVSRMMTVNAAAGTVTHSVDAVGQVTSAIPASGRLVASWGSSLVSVAGNGSLHRLATVDGTPFRLVADSGGGVGFEVMAHGKTELDRYAAGRDTVVAKVAQDSVQLHAVGGTVFVQGPAARKKLQSARLPAGWQPVDVAPDAEVSDRGMLAVTSSVNERDKAGQPLANTPDDPLPISIAATVPATGAHPAFTVQPDPLRPSAGARPSPALATTAGPGAAAHVAGLHAAESDPGGAGTETIDPNRACAIPRNDPHIQTLQPTPHMEEWAADLAVQGDLTVQRPAGWNGSALPAYTPQGLFPMHPLIGGGRIPAQVLLGVLAQESNMWQASPHATDGESGNFEQGGFYGRDGGADSVDFANADCGYGAAQITTGMSVAEGSTVYTPTQQLALTVDYAANIAAGAQMLEDKWNQMKQLGILANNADPADIENWWFALWDYNSGVQPTAAYGNTTGCSPGPSCTDSAGHWGLGWTNNPANPDYPADRQPFLNAGYDDAKTPGHWSYPERVLGWTAHPVLREDWGNGQFYPSYLPAAWNKTSPQSPPPIGQFCQPAADNCDMSQGHCLLANFHCWWHQSSTWVDCTTSCGQEQLAYQAGAAEPSFAGQTLYHSDCSTATLPSNALIVDDVAADVTSNSGCAKTWTDHGTLTWNFGSDSAGNYPSKIDFHQIGTGFGGHYWFAHAWTNTPANQKHAITGTWTLDQPINGWARVLVYIPDNGANDPQAAYTVHGSDSTSPVRTIAEGNYLDNGRSPAPGYWASLGAFNFTGTPSVSLTNMVGSDGGLKNRVDSNWVDGDRDVPWDAIAFQPLPGKPADQVVALGDSYTSGEGASNPPVNGAWDYYRSSDHDGGVVDADNPEWRDACHRSPYSWALGAALPDSTASIGTRVNQWDPTLDFHMSSCSGAVTTNVLPGQVGQYQEGSQIDQGYLDQNTTLVMFSIGGNDALFTPIMQQCILGTECENQVLPGYGDTAPLSVAEPDRINNKVEPAIEQVIQAVHTAAPNAKILLMGYPELLDNSGSCVLGNGDKADEANWIDQMSDVMDAAVQKAAADQLANGIDVAYADPRNAFANEEACGNPEDINGVVLSLTRGDSPTKQITPTLGIVSDQSFHPKVAGAAIYAEVATTVLASMGA